MKFEFVFTVGIFKCFTRINADSFEEAYKHLSKDLKYLTINYASSINIPKEIKENSIFIPPTKLTYDYIEYRCYEYNAKQWLDEYYKYKRFRYGRL